jgi:hypothetical protein
VNGKVLRKPFDKFQRILVRPVDVTAVAEAQGVVFVETQSFVSARNYMSRLETISRTAFLAYTSSTNQLGEEFVCNFNLLGNGFGGIADHILVKNFL